MKYILDSAMGTELNKRGFEVPDWKKSIWSAHALIHNPQAVKEIHEDNIKMGCNVITTNNYYVTPNILKRIGEEIRFEELTQLSIDLAKEASKDYEALIAGSFPPIETSFRPDLTPKDEALSQFYSSIGSIMENEVDLIICETMSSIREGIQAASTAKQYSDRVWLSWTTRGLNGEALPSGESLIDAVNAANELNIECQLINCSAMDIVTAQIDTLKLAGKFGVFANSCILKNPINDLGEAFDIDENHHANTVSVSPKEYALEAKKWIDKGAYVIGGCCSTGPEHIKEISKLNTAALFS